MGTEWLLAIPGSCLPILGPPCNVIDKYIYIELKLCARLVLQQPKELHLVLDTWKILHLYLKWIVKKLVELTKYPWIIPPTKCTTHSLLQQVSCWDILWFSYLLCFLVSFHEALSLEDSTLGYCNQRWECWFIDDSHPFSGVCASEYNITILILRKPHLSCDCPTW